MTFSDASKNAGCDAHVDRLDGGTLNFYTGAPANPPTGTKVATLTFGTPAFGAAAAGVATANAITPDTNCVAGTVASYAIKASGGAVEAWGSAGLAADDPDIPLSTKVFGGGETLQADSLTITVP